MRLTFKGRFQRLAVIFPLILMLLPIKPAHAYSVLAHMDVIDRAWENSIKPLLLRRFPTATPCQLDEARAYCYGGCAIQDLGYLPFSSRFFSDLTHYVRTGDFVTALIRNAADLNEYAFALGALSHYAADSSGHSIAVNKVVPLLYPRLRQKYGNDITYEDNPAAHIQAEFGFDVMQFASGAYATNSFHSAVGFKISERLLHCAFLETYGVDISNVLGNVDFSLRSYKSAALSVVPEMARVAWEMKKDSIEERSPELAHVECHYSGRAGEPACQGRFREAGSFARVTAMWFPIVPRIGPFKALSFKPPNSQTESLFLTSMDLSLDYYRQLLAYVAGGAFLLENINLDTGVPTRPGDYRLADEAYDRLLNELAKNDFRNVTIDLQRNILAFYGQNQMRTARANTRAGTCQYLARLKNPRPCNCVGP